MAPGTPPAALDDRLDALADRVRRQRIVFGLALTLLVAALSGLAFAAFDSALDLSVAVRCALEAGWFMLVGYIAWRFAIRPWQADPPVDEVAERMMADESPNVVAALAREEKDRRAFPAWPSLALASLALLGSLVSLGLALGSGERVRRLALPWHSRSVVAPFEIVVVSGETVARRGAAITLTAYLKPSDPNAVLPDSATLSIRGDGERTVPMTGANGAFHATLPETGRDFEYRVEAGSAASEWFAVRIADAVELAAGTTIAIAPPAYAAAQVKPTVSPFADIDALQYSTATFQLKFSRPAESASIEWWPEGRNPFEAADAFPVALAADRLSGTARLPLRANGLLRVMLVNESGPRRLRTESAIGVRVRPDLPPRFERISGMANAPRSIRPSEPLLIAFTATDDLSIASAELEFATESRSGAVPILLEGGDTARVEGRVSFDPSSVAKEGETIRFRLRVRDSRRVANENLFAQEVAFPPEGRFELKLAPSAPPFDEQQILGQRDDVRSAISAARERIAAARTAAESLRTDTAGFSPLPLDQALRIAAIREELRETRASLDGAAQRTALTAELGTLAASLAALSGGELREADESLQQAVTDDAAKRIPLLAAGVKRLADVLASLERIATASDRLAQDRLDRRRLGVLAVDQSTLAASFKADEPRELFAVRQRELLARLNRIVGDSESLSRAAAALAANESARLADEARRLAERVRELNEAANRLPSSLRRTLLDDQAAAQAILAKRVGEAVKQLEAPARIAAFARPQREDFDRVVDLMRQDKVVAALTELERRAAALEKLADECEAWAADRLDAKLAAGQLAKWQADLRTRHLADPKADLAAEQGALLTSLERLRVPAGAEAVSIRETALVHVRLAKRRLETGAAQAAIAMKLAVDAFDRLAMKTPSLPERLGRGRTELDKLRLEHDANITATERVLQSFEKLSPTVTAMQNIAVKIGPLQIRQAKLAEKLAALDLPNHEARQARAILAVKAAAADLNGGLPYDSVASLGAARRELDRLKHALENQVPADVRTAELTAKQAETLSLVLAAGERATAKQWEPAIALQREVAAGVGEIAAPEAPALLHDAREAARFAELSLRDGSTFEQIVRRLRDAKEMLSLLAERIDDRETERDRIRRLISMRRAAECGARKLAGKPLQPDASAAAREELKRELDELLMTRVGAAAQAAKKKAFESYLRLQNRPEPDRHAADLKQLAEALGEVSSLMASEARLTTRPEPEASPGDPAEQYLPSRKHAEALRELARGERALREELNGTAAAVVLRMKPAPANPFAPLEARQRMLADSLTRNAKDGGVWRAAFVLLAFDSSSRATERLALADRAGALAATAESSRWLEHLGVKKWQDAQAAIRADLERVDANSNAVAAQHQERHAALATQVRELVQQFAAAVADGDIALAEPTEHLRTAERLLADAGRKPQSPGEAARLRAEAIAQIGKAAPPGGPPPSLPPDAVGSAVKSAERAMLRAIRELGPKGDPRAASDALRRAADLLHTATGAVRESR